MTEKESGMTDKERIGLFFVGLLREALAAGWRWDGERWHAPGSEGAKDLPPGIGRQRLDAASGRLVEE